MTITGLNLFLKNKCPHIFIRLPASFFSGKRIVIDGYILNNRFMATAHKEVVNKTDVSIVEPDRDEIRKHWLFRWKDFLNTLLRKKITPIIVFDGERPIIKNKTVEKEEKNVKKSPTRSR